MHSAIPKCSIMYNNIAVYTTGSIGIMHVLLNFTELDSQLQPISNGERRNAFGPCIILHHMVSPSSSI